jgi:hypothetical protein
MYYKLLIHYNYIFCELNNDVTKLVSSRGVRADPVDLRSLNQVIRTNAGMSVPVQTSNLFKWGRVTFVNTGLAHYELSVISCCIKTKQSLHNDA